MKLTDLFRVFLGRPQPAVQPAHLRRGRLGEETARRHLERQGMKCLASNFKTRRGELDLVLRDGECLVFAEVKTRSVRAWARPASSVDRRKRRRLSKAAMEYLRRARHPETAMRFDIVEVLLEGENVGAVRHLPNAFSLSPPYRYG